MASRSSASSATRGDRGLNSEGRPAFTETMEEWISKRKDFEYVLCLDVSRWGRFQDIDLSAQFSAICKKNGKQVIYTTIGKPKENDPLYPVYVQFERFRAAQYSRELSDKVWRGCVKIAEQGDLAGGPPPYGLSRLLLDENRKQVHVLEAGQHKSIQNQRVTLTAGPPEQVAVVQGVRDEIGFLALHQAYANRFFPGTPVLHTQVHYFLFMRWICQSLTGRCALSQNSEAIAEDRKSKLR